MCFFGFTCQHGFLIFVLIYTACMSRNTYKWKNIGLRMELSLHMGLNSGTGLKETISSDYIGL